MDRVSTIKMYNIIPVITSSDIQPGMIFLRFLPEFRFFELSKVILVEIPEPV